MKYKYFLFSFLLISFFIGSASAYEPILITQSSKMNEVIFDGKWTNEIEWKKSSLNTLNYDDESLIQLRTAHQDEFIYVFLDVISDTSLIKGADRAVVCFDTNNDKSTIPKEDDYCFVAVLGSNTGSVFQGGSKLVTKGNFKKIPNPDGFIALGAVSDENDRYSQIPHTSYEFRIPTDLISRTDVYGFHISVFDFPSKRVYSWPMDDEHHVKIPVPEHWGELISPDGTLPEFNWPLLLLLPSLAFVSYWTTYRQNSS